jgi:hypothetical protein
MLTHPLGATTDYLIYWLNELQDRTDNLIDSAPHCALTSSALEVLPWSR